MNNNLESNESIENLMQRLVSIASDMAQIKQQIQDAKTRRFMTGQYADPEWFTKANAALRFKGIEHQRVQVLISEARNRAKKAHRFSDVFERVARKRLPKDVFESIREEALGLTHCE